MRRTLISWSDWRSPYGGELDLDAPSRLVVARPSEVPEWARVSRELGRFGVPAAIGGGSPLGFQNLLMGSGPASADGPTLSAAAEASMIPTAANVMSYAGLLNIVGKSLQVTLMGRFSTAATPGTGQIRIRNGTTQGTTGVVLFDTGAMTLSTSAVNATWKATCILTVRTTGAGTSGTAMVIGEVSNMTGTLGTGARNMIPATAPAVTAGYDATAAPFLNVTWTPSLATASMILHSYLVEEMN